MQSCPAAPALVTQRTAPAYPARLASLRSPPGFGDAYDVTNVGSVEHPFFDDLEPYGFAGECVWGCGPFYDANSYSRGFD